MKIAIVHKMLINNNISWPGENSKQIEKMSFFPKPKTIIDKKNQIFAVFETVALVPNETPIIVITLNQSRRHLSCPSLSYFTDNDASNAWSW
jgi:hypothetical protein